MKKLIVLALVLLPMLLNAGVIVKKSGEQIDDVSIKSVNDSIVNYTSSSGKKHSIAKSELSAILYDDGRYEEIKQQIKVVEEPTLDSESIISKENHTKNSISQDLYEKKEKKTIPQKCYNEASKVYKAVYDETFKKALQQGYSKMQAYNIADDEARIAKQKVLDECYETIVVKGESYRAVEPVISEEEPTSIQKTPKPAKNVTPKECYAEGNKAFNRVYKEAVNKALQLGYSKSQAYKIASDEAQEAKTKAIEECSNRLANE